jgi:hypothetical protein
MLGAATWLKIHKRNNKRRNKMKKVITIAALVCSILTAEAQTNTPTSTNTPAISIPVLTLGGNIPTNITGAANDVIAIVAPIIPYLTNIHGASIDLDGVYSSGNKLGGIAALNLSIPGFMTNYLTIGVAGEYVGNQWYVAPLDLKLGISYNVPLLNIPAYSFVGTGYSYRPSDGASGDQTLIGEAISFQLGKGWYIVGDGGKLLLSQVNAPASSWFGGIRIGKSF